MDLAIASVSPARSSHKGGDAKEEIEEDRRQLPLKAIALSVVSGLQPDKVFQDEGDYLLNVRGELRKIARQR